MKMHQHVRSQRGVGTMEFLVCAPLVALLAFVCFDLNKRAEERQAVTIVSRNAAYLGIGLDKTGETPLRNQTVSQLGTMANVLDPAAFSEMTQAPTRAEQSGLHIAVNEEAQVHDVQELKDRLGAPSNIATVGGGATAVYDVMNAGEGLATQISSSLLSRAQGFGAAIGLMTGDAVRIAGIEVRSRGEADTIQRGAMMLERIVHNVEPGKVVPYPERIHSHGTYARVESGYHAADYRASSFWGMGVGYLRHSNWGGSQDFDDDATELHARCFTRLAVNDACGGGYLASMSAELLEKATGELKDKMERIQKLTDRAKTLADERKQAEEDGNGLRVTIIDGKLDRITKSIEKLGNQIDALADKMGGGSTNASASRKFLSKIRKIATIKAVASIVLAIFTFGESEELNEQGVAMTDMIMQSVAPVIEQQIREAMSNKLSEFSNSANLDEALSSGIDFKNMLSQNGKPADFKGLIGEQR